MSLRTLFFLMALVSCSMIAAVIYTKVIAPEGVRDATMAERRALLRLCNNECDERAPEIARTVNGQAALLAASDACLEECLARVLRGRGLR